MPRSPALSKQNLLIAGSLIVLLVNTAALTREMAHIQQARQNSPYIFLGKKFSGLREMLKNTTSVGYYTDKNLDDNLSARQFAQAQYTMAPVVLDLHNTDHEFIIFDCDNEAAAAAKMKEIPAVPIKRNNFGIILARNLRFPLNQTPATP